MRASDSLLWRIERDPVLRSTITVVSLLDRSPDWHVLEERVLAAGEVVLRMRQRVVSSWHATGSPSWVTDPSFDLAYHLRRVVAPAPATFETAVAMACTQAMSGFDRCRPLWEFTLIEGLEGGQAAFVQKVHHAVTDGIGGMQLALELLDREREPVDRRGVSEPPPPARDVVPGRCHRDLPRASALVTAPLRLLRRGAQLSGQVGGAACRATRAPLRTATSLAESARWSARLLAPVSEPLSPVMRGRSLGLHFDAFEADFPRLQAAGRNAGGHVNDAFLAAVAGGLRRYHDLHDAPVDWLRMTLPVSIRSATDALGSNRFTPVRFAVPVGIADPAERIAAIAALVSEWRSGPALGLTDTLAGALNELPDAVVTSVFARMLKNVDFVATNVPGFRVPVFLAGAELLRQYAFAPTTGAAINVALLTHVGHACVGVNIDTTAVTDPEELVRCLVAGFEEVLELGGAGGPGVWRPARVAPPAHMTPGTGPAAEGVGTPAREVHATPEVGPATGVQDDAGRPTTAGATG